jgi:hypothetical protein
MAIRRLRSLFCCSSMVMGYCLSARLLPVRATLHTRGIRRIRKTGSGKDGVTDAAKDRVLPPMINRRSEQNCTVSLGASHVPFRATGKVFCIFGPARAYFLCAVPDGSCAYHQLPAGGFLRRCWMYWARVLTLLAGWTFLPALAWALAHEALRSIRSLHSWNAVRFYVTNFFR